ncbi:MAG: tol-pal system protein YbgF [Hyphomicrobiaceae bacterium]
MGKPSNLLVMIAVAAGTLLFAQTVAAEQNQSRSTRQTSKSKGSSGQAGDSQVNARLDQLEERLSDMQVTVGTMDSLGRGGAGGGGAARGTGGGVDNARIDSLETQVRALAEQIQQLSDQVRQLSNDGRRGDLQPQGGGSRFAAPLPSYPQGGAGAPAATSIPGFGSTTVTPGTSDPIGRLLDAPKPQNASVNRASSAAAPAHGAAQPREAYETAYGYLLQQDYGAAEASFEDFLKRFPNDRLAGDAEYWLGESLFVQRRYKPAGRAFLAVIEKHKDSSKVPHSLLKLAQSLDHLGQKDCGIFAELDRLNAQTPADVRVRARALKQRQGC